MSPSVARLRIVGLIESASFLALLLIAMPLKYLAGNPEPVRIVGAVHGALWIVYILVLLIAWRDQRWSFVTLLAGGVASVVPLGPLVFDKIFIK